ncbi:hypothetical protein [Sulfitobacter sp. S190]|uniref:hypothetical protein n=1 Tax=Sulfitobacter sp. S190 TaxID=2867022 RepID=UPI0021A6FADA|nr:hypothetical protein [Sulfitobacter sp. S190]UWR23538.1 hypothetical protein K3756_06055 [Sulfitobacter sp. S190]
MIRSLMFCAMLLPAASVSATTAKETDCGYQAQVVSAVQTARIEKVKERKVPEHLAAADPAWPEKYNAVIPLVAPWVYEMKMRDLRQADLGAAWNEMCLAQ